MEGPSRGDWRLRARLLPLGTQLGERGQVEPDNGPLVLVRLSGQAEPSLECDGGGREVLIANCEIAK